jgi:hypothetical protein
MLVIVHDIGGIGVNGKKPASNPLPSRFYAGRRAQLYA